MRIRIVLLALALTAMGCGREPADDHAGFAATVKACTSGKDFACPRPILYVASLDASMKYYRDRLGFRMDWTDGSPPDFGAVTRGETQIFMCQKCQGHAGSWMFVMVPDVDAVHAELKKRGARIKAAPDNKPWGVREMQVVDLDGNVLRIAGPRR